MAYQPSPSRERFLPDGTVLPPEKRELTFALAWLVGTR